MVIKTGKPLKTLAERINFFTIHYYLLLSKNRRVDFSEELIGNSEEVKIANLLSKIGDFWWGMVDSICNYHFR